MSTKDYGEPWHTSSDGKAMWDREGSVLVGRSHARIVACVNACAGIDDPASALAAAREALESCKTSTARLVGSDGEVLFGETFVSYDAAKVQLALTLLERKETGCDDRRNEGR